MVKSIELFSKILRRLNNIDKRVKKKKKVKAVYKQWQFNLSCNLLLALSIINYCEVVSYT